MTDLGLNEVRKIERKWQTKWFEDKIFEPECDGKQKFFLTTPYPYTSGPQHIGHTRTYTIGDIHARFMRMNGHNVLWPMAWHITGTPILAISSCIMRGEADTIELFRSYVRLYEKSESTVEKIVTSFVNPWNIANYFADKIIPDFKKMGFSIDWSRQFTTGDPVYNKFIEWQYKNLNEKGLITHGRHPILFCTLDQNAVGEDDIAGGDVEKISIDAYIGIKFAYNDAYFVAATLRPETIFAVTNLWLAPESTYVKAFVNGERWIISEESARKLEYQGRQVSIIEKYKGRDFIGAFCTSPIGRTVPILPASFVDSNHGTGAVMSVPAHAPYDWAALTDLKDRRKVIAMDIDPNLINVDIDSIKPISLVKIEGYGDFPAVELYEKHGIRSQHDDKRLSEITSLLYREEFYNGILKETAEQFEGRTIQEAKQDIIDFLNGKNAVSDIYETSAKRLCRCGGEVIVAIESGQYFLNYGNPGWKATAFELLENLKIVPEMYRSQFTQTFEWLDKRPCVRRRGLGTRFPYSKENWIIEPLSDSVIYMALYTIIKHIRDVEPSYLTPVFFDYVFSGKGDLDSVATATGIPKDIIQKARGEFEYWYPNDHRHTSIAHISNHLSFFLFHHAILFPRKYWPKVITLNELLIREGVKMSKSKGNVIPIATISEKYSADLVRLYLASIADLNSTIDWREKDVEMVKKRLLKFWSSAKQDIRCKSSEHASELSFASKWILAATNSMVVRAAESASQYSYRKYITEAFFNHLNAVEDYKLMVLDIDEKQRVLFRVMEKWLRVLAPVIPHISEELWLRMGNVGYISLAEYPTYEDVFAQTLVEKSFVDNVIDDITSILSVIKAVPTSIYIYLPADWKRELYTVVRRLEDLSIGNIIATCRNNPILQPHMKQIAQLSKEMSKEMPREGEYGMVLDSEAEIYALESLKDYISWKFNGAIVNIFKEDTNCYDPAMRAQRSLPMRPAIYVE